MNSCQEGLVMSIATDCSARTKEALRTACQDVPCHEEDDGSFQQRCQSCEPWNVVVASSVASIEDAASDGKKQKLANDELPALEALTEVFAPAGYRELIQEVTGCGELCERVDLATQVYTKGSHLLCHDDVIGTRKVPLVVAGVDSKKVTWRRDSMNTLEPCALLASAALLAVCVLSRDQKPVCFARVTSLAACEPFEAWGAMLAFCSPSMTVQMASPATAAPRERLHSYQRFSECTPIEPSHEDYDTLLMKAGLRNLLGVEENRMARKLEEACQVSTDLKRCLSDVEVKHKIAKDEVEELSLNLSAAQADNDALRAENKELTDQVKTMKESASTVKAKNSEQWAAQKAAENERDKAILELTNVKEQAEAAQIEADSKAKSLKAEVEALRAELKETKAEMQKLKGKTVEVSLAARFLFLKWIYVATCFLGLNGSVGPI
eukprot:g27940.t1